VWSADGGSLLLVTARQLVLFDAASGRAHALPMQGVSAAAYSRTGRLAVVRRNALVVFAGGESRTVFTAPGRLRGVVWSPDGRWLLTELPSAGQWIFVGGRRVLAVSHIPRELGGMPALDGWMPGP
jgi:hypothetical protein